jgi:hypothetical protein
LKPSPGKHVDVGVAVTQIEALGIETAPESLNFREKKPTILFSALYFLSFSTAWYFLIAFPSGNCSFNHLE